MHSVWSQQPMCRFAAIIQGGSSLGNRETPKQPLCSGTESVAMPFVTVLN
jgi:hypothetical protein